MLLSLCIKVAAMADLLALLDAAIDELDAADSSRCSRSRCDTERRTGTDSLLRNKAVPVVPVVPVQKRDSCRSITDTADTKYQHGPEGRAREYPSRKLGTTGTTGTDEAFCGSPVPMRGKENGDEWEHGTRETGAIESRAPTLPTDPAAIWGIAEEDRAAITEHDGLIPRAWAEGFARLHPDRPPGDVPRHRWQRFVDDVGRFLDDQWADKATALGWGPLDLFGCDRDRPFARINHAELLWLLSGDRLLALTENTATIATKTGARQTYRRKPSEPGGVLAWELADGGPRGEGA
jgi:hypothetical protein